jgi:hypothetical protein
VRYPPPTYKYKQYFLIKKGNDIMMNKKMTIKDYYNELLAIGAVAERADLVEFIEGRIEVLNRKSASGEKKMTANQLANEVLKVDILAQMEKNRMYAISEMIKQLPCCATFSSSKITAMMTQLLKSGDVVRTEDKGKAYYSKA